MSAPAELTRFETELARLCEGLDSASVRYLSGVLAGLALERERQGAAPPAATGTATRATVLYASQTGNGRRVAERLHRQLESHGLAARLVDAGSYRVRDLATERLLYLVVSTHGDGDPPDDARGLLDVLEGRKASRLESLRYAVLALGDSSYPRFCAAGRRFDQRLAALGATRLAVAVECDVDFSAAAEAWTAQALGFAREHLQAPHLAIVSRPVAPRTTAPDRDTPVELELVSSTRITARDAERAVHHLEFAIPDSFAYEPGDAVGVWHENPAFVVDALVAHIGARADEIIEVDGVARSLGDWLRAHREVTRLARPFLEAHAARADAPVLTALLQPSGLELLRTVLRDWQPLDLLEQHPAPWTAAELVRALRPLTPRLYSIASSRAAVGAELHVTVAAVDYHYGDARRVGAASHHLAQLDASGGPRVRAYLEPNPRFRLPADGARDLIMIGPGTGVAPFRGFLQQRIESGASGRHWLLFGGRHLASDFLYQAEWLEARRDGHLHRLDVAFSRDQAAKVYVQHRLREHGETLWRWIEEGASLYVCGDAQRMAPDVHEALLAVIEHHGGRSRERAEETLAALAAERRYARDVY